jgi:hypothetical protein
MFFTKLSLPQSASEESYQLSDHFGLSHGYCPEASRDTSRDPSRSGSREHRESRENRESREGRESRESRDAPSQDTKGQNRAPPTAAWLGPSGKEEARSRDSERHNGIEYERGKGQRAGTVGGTRHFSPRTKQEKLNVLGNSASATERTVVVNGDGNPPKLKFAGKFSPVRATTGPSAQRQTTFSRTSRTPGNTTF